MRWLPHKTAVSWPRPRMSYLSPSSTAALMRAENSSADIDVLPNYRFFGRGVTWAQRLHRLRCGFSLQPHFGHRRSLSFLTKSVRGRVRIISLSVLQAK